MINKLYTLQDKSYKFVNEFYNAIDIEIFINKFHRNGVNYKIGFILEHGKLRIIGHCLERRVC